MPNNVYGYGRLDILAAYRYAASPPPTPTPASGYGSTGLLSPGASAAQTSGAGDNDGFEVSPASAYADGGGAAQDIDSGTNVNASCTANSKDKHRFSNYGVSLPPGATVTGIEVRLDALADSASNGPRLCVQLSWDGGSTWTDARQTATLGAAEATYVLGGASDTWGRAWKADDLSDARFRVRVIDVASGAGANARDFALDWVAVRVSYR